MLHIFLSEQLYYDLYNLHEEYIINKWNKIEMESMSCHFGKIILSDPIRTPLIILLQDETDHI